MATAFQFPVENSVLRPQTTGTSGGRASVLRLVANPDQCAANGCEVVLSNEEYAQFREMLEAPAEAPPGLMAMFRERRLRRKQQAKK